MLRDGLKDAVGHPGHVPNLGSGTVPAPWEISLWSCHGQGLMPSLLASRRVSYFNVFDSAWSEGAA